LEQKTQFCTASQQVSTLFECLHFGSAWQDKYMQSFFHPLDIGDWQWTGKIHTYA